MRHPHTTKAIPIDETKKVCKKIGSYSVAQPRPFIRSQNPLIQTTKVKPRRLHANIVQKTKFEIWNEGRTGASVLK